jgi:hypothetical protein
VPLFADVFRLVEGRLVGDSDPAGAEVDVEVPIGVDGADRARRQARARLGPANLAVEPDLVLVAAGRLEAADADQGVVVALDPEGPLAVAEDLYLAGLGGLDPDRRLGFGDVAEDGA